MKKLFLAILISLPLIGQTLQLSCPQPTIIEGQTINCPLTLVGSASNIFGLQWTITVSPSLGPETFTLFSSLISSGFSTASNNGTTIVFNLNPTAIGNQIIGIVSFTAPPTLVCNGNSPCVALTISNTIASSKDGTSLPLSPGPVVSLGAVNLCAISEGTVGQTSNADIVAEENYVLTGNPSGDRDADGKSTILDLVIMINSLPANGGICTAKQ